MASEFQRLVYGKTKEIPKGRVSTYKEIAKAIGRPDAHRAVGNALNRNPTPNNVPCHRVVRSDKKIGGFSKGTEAKKRLLEGEGMAVYGDAVVGEMYTF